MLTTVFRQSLGEAYHLAQVSGDRATAIAKLRAAIESAPHVRAEAEAEKRRLDEFARSIRGMGRGACHISKVQHDLLKAALT